MSFSAIQRWDIANHPGDIVWAAGWSFAEILVKSALIMIFL